MIDLKDLLLQAPDYSVSGTVDNTEYDSEHADRFTVDGKSSVMEEDVQFAHYDSNMASLMQLGKWFDYMRKNGVYDNTRIILVADHGRGLYLNWDRVIDNGPDTDFFFPLLMVKDFNAKGFSFSDTFMTTADVPTLATSGLIDNPTNPSMQTPNMTGRFMHSCPTIGTLPKTTATSSFPATGTGSTIRTHAISTTGSRAAQRPSCRTPCADPAAPPTGRVD